MRPMTCYQLISIIRQGIFFHVDPRENRDGPEKRSLSMLYYDVSRGQSYGKHCRNALYGRLQEASQPQFAPAGPLIINYNHAPGSLFFHVDPKQNRDGPEKSQARNTLLWTYNDVLARFACILRVLFFMHISFFHVDMKKRFI